MILYNSIININTLLKKPMEVSMLVKSHSAYSISILVNKKLALKLFFLVSISMWVQSIQIMKFIKKNSPRKLQFRYLLRNYKLANSKYVQCLKLVKLIFRKCCFYKIKRLLYKFTVI